MKKTFSRIFLTALMGLAATATAHADITIRVNVPDVVQYISDAAGTRMMLAEGDNVIKGSQIVAALKISTEAYTLTCTNLTAGMPMYISETRDWYSVYIDPSNTADGDVIEVTLEELGPEGRTFSVVFDNPDAGYVAYLTDYDNSDDSCLGENPLESNEDIYFQPDASGVLVLPYEFNRRMRIRPYDGYSLVKVWNEQETNPHATGYTPNSRGVVEMNLFTIGSFNTVRVTTSEHGTFTVSGTGPMIEDIYMVDNTTYERIAVTEDSAPIVYIGQTYTIRSESSSLTGVELTRKGVTAPLESINGYHNYLYVPDNGDELVIHTKDVTTGVEAVGQETLGKEKVFNLQGMEVKTASDGSLDHLPAGIYIRGGKKIIVK